MVNIKNPCHKCNAREVGCHANCELYLEFCEKKDKIKRAKEERIEMACYGARIKKRIDNYKKNHKISY